MYIHFTGYKLPSTQNETIQNYNVYTCTWVGVSVYIYILMEYMISLCACIHIINSTMNHICLVLVCQELAYVHVNKPFTCINLHSPIYMYMYTQYILH